MGAGIEKSKVVGGLIVGEKLDPSMTNGVTIPLTASDVCVLIDVTNNHNQSNPDARVGLHEIARQAFDIGMKAIVSERGLEDTVKRAIAMGKTLKAY